MIYTVTLNPALDYNMYPENLAAGEINRSSRESLHFGGKGINVSFILNELGIPSVATGFIAGFTGDALESAVSAFAKTDFVRLKKGLTRINVKLRAENETDINAAGPEISNTDTDRLFKKLEKAQAGDTVVLSGSVPKSVPADIYGEIMKKLSPRRIKFAVDAAGEALLNSQSGGNKTKCKYLRRKITVARRAECAHLHGRGRRLSFLLGRQRALYACGIGHSRQHRGRGRFYARGLSCGI